MSNIFLKKLIIVAGPNAVGKSALAVKLAKAFNGEVISADSRQVYKGFDLGAGKITKKEMQGIHHHLLGVANPKRNFTVAHYQKLGRKTLRDVLKRRKLPIVCGGTGFYIRALIDGIVFPEVRPNYKLRKILNQKSATELWKMLKKQDPERARNIDVKNPRRLIRALEIVQALGKVPQKKSNPPAAEVLMLGIQKDKKALKKLIEQRLTKRLRLGMLKEIQNLHKKGLSWQRLENFGLEYRYGTLLLQGKISKEQFRKDLIQASMKYAKRQITWFKCDQNIHWIKNQKQAEKITREFLK